MNFETRILLNRELINAKTRKRDLRRETRLETRKKVHDKTDKRRENRFRVFTIFNSEVPHNLMHEYLPFGIGDLLFARTI